MSSRALSRGLHSLCCLSRSSLVLPGCATPEIEAARRRHASSGGPPHNTAQWQFMKQQGHKLNPCNSLLHPAVEAGIQPDGDEVRGAGAPILCLAPAAAPWIGSPCCRR